MDIPLVDLKAGYELIKDEFKEYLANKGIETGIHYKVPIHLQKGCRGYGYQEGDFPQTEEVSKLVLSLPMYPELTGDKIEYITQSMKAFYGGNL